MSSSSERNHWHPGYVGAMELELRDWREQLHFEDEHTLAKEPMRMDLLVIKKDPGLVMSNQIGEVFRGHNIIEFKSPGDALNIDDYYKTVGYACLYKGLGKYVNEIPAEELTVTLMREGHPRKLFKMLREFGCKVEARHAGVYDVSGVISFPTQVIVTQELEAELHPSLSILTRQVDRGNATGFIKMAVALTEPGDKRNAEAVFQVSLAANREVYGGLKEESTMYNAFQEFFKDEWEAYCQEQTAKLAEQIQEKLEKQIQEKLEKQMQEKLEKQMREQLEEQMREELERQAQEEARATQHAAEQAAQEATDTSLSATLRSLMSNTGWGVEEAMNNMGIPVADQPRYAAMV